MPSSARRRVMRRDRVVASGLAGVACLGVAGLVVAREAGLGAPVPDAASASGLSAEDLDAYAQQLTREQARLAWYRSELLRIAQDVAEGRVPPAELTRWIAAEQEDAADDPAADAPVDSATYSS